MLFARLGPLKSPREYARTFLGHSSVLSHLRNLFEGLIWSAIFFRKDGRTNVAVLNHLSAALLDCVLGIVFMHFFLSLVTPQLLVDWTMSVIDVCFSFLVIVFALTHKYYPTVSTYRRASFR